MSPAASLEKRSYVARLFDSLANTLLDLGLPRIRAWLRERVGPDADVAHVTADGKLIHLDGVRIPLGPRGLVVLERATAAIAPSIGARLHAFRGEIVFGAEEGGAGEPSFRAEVSFRGEDDADASAWIAGELRIERASWTPRRGAPAAEAMTGAARLYVTSTAWRLEGGQLKSEHASVRFDGRGIVDPAADEDEGPAPLVPRVLGAAKLLLEPARVGPFVDAMVAIGGRSLTVPAFVPLDARLEGAITWSADAGARCDLRVTSDAVHATLRAATAASGGELQARLEAELRPAVTMRALGIAPFALPREEDRVRLEIDATGDVMKPVVRGTLRGDELGFRFGRPRFVPPSTLRDVTIAITSEGGSQAHLVASGRASHGKLELSVAGAVAVDLVGAPALSGAVTLSTARSSVTIEPVLLRRADPTGTRIRGAIAVEDVLDTGLAFGALRPRRAGDLSVDLVVDVTGGSPELRGAITSKLLVVDVLSRPEAAPIELRDVSGDVVVGRDALRCEKLRCAASGEGWLDPGARLAGEIHVRADRSLVADVSLGTPAGSALAIHAIASVDGRLDGSTIRGALALSDALLAGAFDGAVHPLPEGTAQIDATLRGSLDDLVVSGWVAADALRIGIRGSAMDPFALRDLRVLFRADERKLVWHRLEARGHGGAISSAGIIGRAPAFEGAAATLTLRAVDAATLPIPGGYAGTFVRGRVDGAIRFDRRDRRTATSARGQVELHHGAFPVLALTRAPLARYGLAPPAEHAIAPATFTLALADDRWSFTAVRAWVQGASLAGELHVCGDSALDGRFVVTLEEEFLQASAMLVLPSVFAERLTLPVRIAGAVASPRVDADLASCLNRLVTDNRVSAFVTSAVEEAAALFRGTSSSHQPPTPPEPPIPPPAPDDDVLLRELATSEWDELALRLDDHRRSTTRYRIG